MKIQERYQRLLSRRAPSEDRGIASFSESFESQQGEFTKYILGALKPVEQKYTARLIEQGDRVENQLQKRILTYYPSIEFRRQGSVSNLTHIRFYSDVDVLVIIDKFYSMEPPQQPTIPYLGVPVDDLLELRKKCASELSQAFPAATVDNSGSSAINLSGGSLACDVDIVPANWYNTNLYAQQPLEHLRGIQILNKDEAARKKNYPFLFNHRISESDRVRLGATRMLIRLLKTIRSDSEEEKKPIDFSSFDICSVVYAMPDQFFKFSMKAPLEIIKNLEQWMSAILNFNTIRDALMVVDDSRKLFDKQEKAVEFAKLRDDLLAVYNGAKQEMPLQFLTEAHFK